MKKIVALLLALFLMTGASALADFNETGLPIVNEPFEFTILVDESGLPEDKIMFPILEEQTGVTVNLMCYPYEAAKERLGILLNSGDYPEVIGGWLLGGQDILDLSADGVIIPIDELVAKYAPNMFEILEMESVRTAFTLPDGHIYTIPYVIDEPLVTFLPYINKEWLDNLNLEVPTTTAEFKEALIAFRDNDANGNGDPSDEIPFSGDPNNLSLGTLAGWFGVDAATGSTAYRNYALVDGKLQFSANTEQFKDFIEFFADLYAEGLIDPELFTQDLSMWKAKGNQNLYGCSIAYGSGDFMEWVDNTTPFVPLPVLTSDNGSQPIFHRNSYGVTFFRSQVVLTDKCDEETAAIILRWFDNTFEPDNSAQIQWGVLGVNIEKVGENVYQELSKADWDDAKVDKYSWSNFYCQSLPKDMIGLELKAAEDRYNEKETADALYEPYLNERFPSVWPANEADANRVAILSTDINEYVNTKIAQWVSGEADVNAEWDAYLAQLESYGLSELTEIYARIIGVEVAE